MSLFFYSIFFIFGLVIGSFLNVVIFRLERGGKIMNDRSKCLYCKHILAWYDLVPVLSFMFLKGKCRYCGKKISWQYPIVEIATGILFVVSLRATEGSAAIPYLGINGIASSPPLLAMTLARIIYCFFIISSLIVIFVYDLRHYIIPDKVIYPAIVVSLVFVFVDNFLTGSNLQFTIYNLQSIFNFQFSIYNLYNSVFVNHLFAAIVAGAFFLSIILITRGKGMGGGDVKLGFLMGLILGWPSILLAMFLSFIFGSVVGLVLILTGKKGMKSMIPFGPFLVLGTFVAMFWGKEIIKWYFNTLIY